LRISFLIPSFNHSRYIGCTLDSIQTDADGLNFEIIIIDDGSTDDSRLIIDAWCKLHPLVNIRVTYRDNRGASATANELVRQASGEVIRFCASDDGVYAGSSFKIIQRFKESDALVLVGDAFVVDDAGKIVGNSAIKLSGGVPSRMQTLEGLKKEIVTNWSIPGPCFAIRKQVYEIAGFYAEDLVIEDWDFFLRVAALCPIQFVNEYFSYYRVHAGNTSRTSNIAKRVRNLNAQLTAGKRRSYLFNGWLRVLLEFQCIRLKLKIFIFRFAMFFILRK
jgi:glycosyltransferase involved in cell wall biosynthesis